MLRRVLLPALAAVLAAGSAGAQISFSSDPAFSSFTPGVPVERTTFSTDGGDVPAADQARIDALIALRGADRTWDFRPIAFPAQVGAVTTVYDERGGLPGADQFPSANSVVSGGFIGATGPDSVSYTYGVLTDESYTVLGVFIEDAVDGEDYVQRYEPDGIVRLTFPYTFGTTVSDEAQVTTSLDVGGAVPTVREEVEVVGYGTLVLPAGSYACLMARRTVTVSASVGGQSFSTTTEIYSWETKDRVAATATNYETPQGPRVYTAQYTVPRSGGGTATEPGAAALSLVAAPNPAGGAAALRLTTAAPLDARVAVWDALGRRVAVLWDGPVGAGTTAFALDTAALAPGVYVARADAGGRALSVRLTVAR